VSQLGKLGVHPHLLLLKFPLQALSLAVALLLLFEVCPLFVKQG
jgi:hypothetical protein